MKIVTVSLNQDWEDKESNIRRIKGLMLEISRRQPDLVIFPEMTLTAFTMSAESMGEEYSSSPTIEFFAHLAVEHKTAIAFGVILKTNFKPTNNLVVVSKAGSVLARYEKIHPFSYSGETEYYSKGEKVVDFKLQDFTIGLTICYDLRFPELYQALSRQCDVILNIANWPARRVKDWRLLLHARALENQCYMIGVNRTGVDGKGLEYEKSTIVVDPMGNDVAPTSLNDEIDIFEINRDVVSTCRESFPIKKDRRIELYKNIL